MTTDFKATKAQFAIPDGIIYLDGNSLGPLPRDAAARVARTVTEEWGQMLITGWNKAGWMDQPARIGDRIARLIGARERLSHEYENHSWVDRWLVTRSTPQDYSVHVMDNNARLLGLLGLTPQLGSPGYEVFLSDAERQWAADWLKEHGLEGRAWLGIHAGSGGTKNLALRRWPVDRYVSFLRQWRLRHPGVPVVLFGAREEQPLHAAFRGAGAEFIEAATPGLREAMALVGHAGGFLSVDTVFMHVAAAMRVPRQWVIETPTLNPPVHPRRDDWTLIPNPSIQGRHLDYYRYDGRPIAGSAVDLVRMMAAVSAESVMEALSPWADSMRRGAPGA